MTFSGGNRFFDISTLFILGVAAILLISLPGGCGDNGDDAENGDSDVIAEPTSPPMMEIVDPEPGDLDVSEPTTNDTDVEQAPAEDGDEDQETGQEEQPSDSSYVVREGDTLYVIALQFNVSVDALMEANGMSDANALQVGQVLEIPH